ncbi:hypothetical protein BDV95DRAFT_320158 [Massariosphaeria phaeospora]|uniref:Uncharacterized protein n=1 Tax=Massariosphaeria phaeospora TaxID=100035 RepID=A0A7C8MSS7_9PLEO|nr:hypothetical protein BDV95DRAFT_320158 [Massariosphaeria phaeospora]
MVVSETHRRMQQEQVGQGNTRPSRMTQCVEAAAMIAMVEMKRDTVKETANGLYLRWSRAAMFHSASRMQSAPLSRSRWHNTPSMRRPSIKMAKIGGLLHAHRMARGRSVDRRGGPMACVVRLPRAAVSPATGRWPVATGSGEDGGTGFNHLTSPKWIAGRLEIVVQHTMWLAGGWTLYRLARQDMCALPSRRLAGLAAYALSCPRRRPLQDPELDWTRFLDPGHHPQSAHGCPRLEAGFWPQA